MIFNILMIFWHKRKSENFDPYNVLLAIATNIPVWIMTGFVVQGHISVMLIDLFNQKYSKIVKYCFNLK